jgi:hypothetical protein
MILADFNERPYQSQLALVHAEGAFIATRWQQVDEAVLLYEMPGHFFAELTYNTVANEILYLFAFEAGSEDDRLPDYAMFVQLPDWLQAD